MIDEPLPTEGVVCPQCGEPLRVQHYGGEHSLQDAVDMTLGLHFRSHEGA